MNMLQPAAPPLQGIYHVNQPPFLTNNWRAIQISDHAEYSKFIKVRDGIANITNGRVLVRSRIGDVPEGFYMFGDDGYLYDSKTEAVNLCSKYGTYNRFPDVDVLRVDMSSMTFSTPVLAEEIRQMIDFINHVRSQEVSEIGTRDYQEQSFVVFDGNTLYSRSIADLWFRLSFSSPVNADTGYFHANSLRHVLTDMLRYPHVFFGRDCRGVLDDAPLFIGVDWNGCGLIKVV